MNDYLKKTAKLQNSKSLRHNLPEFEDSCQLIATAARVVKASFVSAGNSMSFFPVAAAPAVPAPAPAAAPIAAPLPPPASAPMMAPPAAPPPMNPASRLPLPPNVLPAELVANVYVLPPTVDRKSTRLNSSHGSISYAVFCLKKNTTYHRAYVYAN